MSETERRGRVLAGDARTVLLHDPECVEACAAACAVDRLVRHAGTSRSGARRVAPRPASKSFSGWGSFGEGVHHEIQASAGTADRFFPCFRYQPKARGAVRDAFLPDDVEDQNPAAKPPPLGAWFATLVCDPGDVVLDVYAGWGGLH